MVVNLCCRFLWLRSTEFAIGAHLFDRIFGLHLSSTFFILLFWACAFARIKGANFLLESAFLGEALSLNALNFSLGFRRRVVITFSYFFGAFGGSNFGWSGELLIVGSVHLSLSFVKSVFRNWTLWKATTFTRKLGISHF